MILSVSRRTDIPCYYSDWFYKRIKEGFVFTRNPFNPRQISRIALSPDVVDCIVFWTKNPAPMLPRLGELDAYKYYFQFTLTSYGRDVERNLPDKKEILIPTFRRLSDKIGPKRVVWRYDPIFFNDRYTQEYHLKAFEQIAESLNGYTERCIISFLDMYPKIQKNMDALGTYELEISDYNVKKAEETPVEITAQNIAESRTDRIRVTELESFASSLAKIAHQNGMEIYSCAEKVDLESCGIRHSSCIDKALVEEIIGCRIAVNRDKNQRKECGCVGSVEVGTYNTCRNGCQYCYANYSHESVGKNVAEYDPSSPILCGKMMAEDKLTERKVKSLKVEQMSLFQDELL